MSKEMIEKELVELLDRMGIMGITTDNFATKSSDVINDYIDDSLQFVNFIVSIEKIFKISLPDSFLFADFSITFEILVEYIQNNIK